MNKEKATEIQFGSYNVETGERQDGVFVNNKMEFRRKPWWRRIFMRRISKTEYIGTTSCYEQLIWSSKRRYSLVAVYRKYCVFTNKTLRLYSVLDGMSVDFNIDHWNETGGFIEA